MGIEYGAAYLAHNERAIRLLREQMGEDVARVALEIAPLIEDTTTAAFEMAAEYESCGDRAEAERLRAWARKLAEEPASTKDASFTALLKRLFGAEAERRSASILVVLWERAAALRPLILEEVSKEAGEDLSALVGLPAA